MTEDLELNVWEGGARAGWYHGGIVGVTHVYDQIPNVTATVLDDYVLRFKRGDVILVDDTIGLYFLNTIPYRHWQPLGGAIVNGATESIGDLIEHYGDDDTITSRAGINEATEAIKIYTEEAQPPIIIGWNNWNIWVEGLNVDELDNFHAEEIVPSFIWDYMTAGDNVSLASGTHGEVIISATMPTPQPTFAYQTPVPQNTPTPQATVVLTGSGIAEIGEVTGGYDVHVPAATAQTIPTPVPTKQVIAGSGINVLSTTASWIVSTTGTVFAGAWENTIGDGVHKDFDLNHNLGYQYPYIAVATNNATRTRVFPETRFSSAIKTTLHFNYIPSVSEYVVVAWVGGGGIGSGTTIINVTEQVGTSATPITITGSGIATVVPIDGGYNVHVTNPTEMKTWTPTNTPTITPTYTNTPTQTYTPSPTPTQTPTVTPTPTPAAVISSLGDDFSTDYDLIHNLGTWAVGEVLIGSTSQVVYPEMTNLDGDTTRLSFNYAVPEQDFTTLLVAPFHNVSFGNAGLKTAAITHNLNTRPLVFIETSDHKWNFPVEVGYTSANVVSVTGTSVLEAMTARFLLPDGEQAIGNGLASSYSVTTNAGTRNVIVQVWETGTNGRLVGWPQITVADNTVSVTFNYVPTTNEYTVVWKKITPGTNTLDDVYVRLDGRTDRKYSLAVPHGRDSLDWLGDSLSNQGDISLGMNRLNEFAGSRLWLKDREIAFGQIGLYTGLDINVDEGEQHTFRVDGTHRAEITGDGIEVTGSANITKDATAEHYFGDIIHTENPPVFAGTGLSERTVGNYKYIDFITPTPIPTSTPTPVATPIYLLRSGDVSDSTVTYSFPDGNIEDTALVESRVFRFRAVTVPTEAALLALLHDGDAVYWLPGGSIISYGDLQLEKAVDTGNWFITFEHDGTKDKQKLTRYSDCDFERNRYVLALRLDGEIYCVQGWKG
jgi:hypothetical protein